MENVALWGMIIASQMRMSAILLLDLLIVALVRDMFCYFLMSTSDRYSHRTL